MSFASDGSKYGQKLNAVATAFELAVEAMEDAKYDSVLTAQVLVESLQRQGYRIIHKSASVAGEVVRSVEGEGGRS